MDDMDKAEIFNAFFYLHKKCCVSRYLDTIDIKKRAGTSQDKARADKRTF